MRTFRAAVRFRIIGFACLAVCVQQASSTGVLAQAGTAPSSYDPR